MSPAACKIVSIDRGNCVIARLGLARPILHQSACRNPARLSCVLGGHHLLERLKTCELLQRLVDHHVEAIMTGMPMTNFADLDAPIPSRFVAGCFSFSIGRFLEDVPPDPKLYFRGGSMCTRGYTRGYDLFHPHKIVCWHESIRKGHGSEPDDKALART